MTELPWSQYDQALKRIHEKLNEIKAVLEAIKNIDGVKKITEAITASINNFPQDYPDSTAQARLQNIYNVLRKSAPIVQKIDLTASGQIRGAPGTGKRIRILAFCWSSDADIITALRFGSGDLLFPLQQKGAIGMNLIGREIDGPENTALNGYLSGAGNMKGTVLLEEVTV